MDERGVTFRTKLRPTLKGDRSPWQAPATSPPGRPIALAGSCDHPLRATDRPGRLLRPAQARPTALRGSSG